MTDDLISRQAAIDALDEIEAEVADGYGYQYAKWREYFVEMPPAQPEPKEGHWILRKSPDGDEQYECSECGVLWEFIDGTPEDNEAYFCPNCGAKMDEEIEGRKK